jgi:5-methylcytosine-specific restriction endonuclease McrA
MQTLVLTPWYRPHEIVSWQAAVTLLFLGKIEVLEEYDDEIRSPSVCIRAPAVARLVRGFPASRARVRFSRRNVFLRDGHRCQYCGAKKAPHELNLDHVTPRSKGGRTTWENIVTSCYACNLRKGGRTPREAKMPLRAVPAVPRSLPRLPLTIRSVPAEWVPYAGTSA